MDEGLSIDELESRMRPRSPQIVENSWGVLVVEGLGKGGDFKLWPGGGRAWDWAETGTHHVPGIQPGDLEELIEQGSQVVVLSRGRDLQLQTSGPAIELLKELRVPFHIEETGRAISLYNELAGQGRAVGGLFHSTC